MGLFYVWFKYYYPRNDSHDQRLIAFVNREVADEWWRTISTPPSVHAGKVKRISPQLYVQIQGNEAWKILYDAKSPETRHFFERMFLPCTGMSLDYVINVAPQNEVTDHINGLWYFIRSKADPSSYWYLRTSGVCAVCADAGCDAVHVSSDARTRFCIRVRNDAQVPEDFVMIGKDEISIAAPKGYVLYINDAGDLKAKQGYQGETDLLFSDLKKRFVTRTERRVNGELWEYVESVERGVGEPWELFGE